MLRVIREYSVIDSLIVHGYAHQLLDNWQAPPAGGLFHRCVASPSKDNLPKGYKDDPNSWAFFYSWSHDGNFSAQHTVSRQPGNNVPIFPGTGAFQHPDEVKEALASVSTDRKLKEKDPELARLHVPSFREVSDPAYSSLTTRIATSTSPRR